MGMVNLMLGMLPDLDTPGLDGREPPARWVFSAAQRENILEREPERTLPASRLSIPYSQQLLAWNTELAKLYISNYVFYCVCFPV